MCWLRVEEGWVYVPEHVLENPYRTTSEFLREDYAPYTVLPKAEAKEAELPRLNEKGDAPEKTKFTAEEASRMRGVIFQDAGGDFWKNFDGYWKFRSIAYSKYLSIEEVPSRVLSSDYEPYTFLGYREDELDEEDGVPRFQTERFDTAEPSKNTAAQAMEYHFSTDAGPAFSEEVTSLYRNEDIEVEKTEDLTVEDLLKRPDRLYYDSDGDLWGYRDGKWAWGKGLGALDLKLSGSWFRHTKPFGGREPYRVAEGVSLPKTEPEPDAGPALSEEVTSLYGNEDIEVEKTPTITESLNKIAKSLERIAKALEEK